MAADMLCEEASWIIYHPWNLAFFDFIEDWGTHVYVFATLTQPCNPR